jgi:hypothetical protein
MARLIPSFMDDRTPPGERDVFNLLAGGPDDWVALHSLDLAPWHRGIRTEIDFLVIAPDVGLLCIEVKSHEAIAFEGGRWYPAEIKRSPFKQAADAAYTFHRRLREIAPQFAHVPVIHGCIFPRASFDLRPNLSVASSELIDARVFRAFRNGMDLCADLRARMIRAIEADQNLHALPKPLLPGQVDALLNCCVPVQKRRVRARDEIARREQEVDRLLRDQQRPIVQLADLNARVVVSGAAGTGKTLIAMEIARRAADRGARVALLCFNQLVGDWMKRQLERGGGVSPALVVGRAIRVMAEMTEIAIPKEPPHEFWDNDLPDAIQEHLTNPEFESAAAFDYLVVDEAQDLLARPRIWECVAGFLKGGTAEGAFCLLGDFDHQVLAAREPMSRSLAATRTVGRPTLYRLSENCRNYRIVGDSAVRLSGLPEPVYEGYRRTGGGIHNYDIHFYANDREQRDKLVQWLREFKTQGYRPDEITVLSFRAPEQSAAFRLAQEGYRVTPVWQQAPNSIGYASVHAFKGLENKIILLTDVVLAEAEFHRDLFYTGMTRACESVRILCHHDSQQILTGWFSGRTIDE